MKNKIIRLTENDIQNLVQKIIKESYSNQDLLKTVLKAMVDNNLISPSKVNIYDDNFEVYGFNGPNFDYFIDNHIIFEKGGESEVFLNFEMYEEDVDMQDALKVSDWLYPKLQLIFGDEIFFMDNLDDEDYMEDMPKPGIGQKLKQGARDLFGLSNKNDSETLAQIHNLIKKGMVDNVRHNGDAITAWVNNKALIVDIGENPEIIYNGRNLAVADLESVAIDLRHELINHL